jgi:PKD repeat protein
MKALFLISLAYLLNSFSFQVSAQDAWSGFKYPSINYVNEDKSSFGSKLFTMLVPNPDSLFKARILEVCKFLYQKPSEVRYKKTFDFKLRSDDGVAATGGDAETIDMFMSTTYLSNFFKNCGNNEKVMLDEIIGIITHELVHAYQNSPSGYPVNTEVFSCIEGMADAVRIQSGYMPFSRKPGGHWNDGYRTTGYFVNWLVTKDPDFIYKYNLSAGQLKSWSWDQLTQQVFGKPVIDLWGEYQRYLARPVATIASDTTSTVTHKPVLFYDKSTGYPYVWKWTFEGGNPSSSNAKSTYVNYEKAGTYKVSLTVLGAFGADSITKIDYVTVKENPDGKLITSLEGEKSALYNDSPESEGVNSVFDAKAFTKYLTFHNSGWVQFDAKKGQKFIVKKYYLTSANDAAERDPKNFILKGSNDGKKWEEIDSRTDIKFSGRLKTLGFAPDASKKAYSKFRLEMVNNEGNILQLADLKLFGVPSN